MGVCKVDAAEPFAHFTAADKELRTRLRARGRQAGDVRDDKKKTQSIDQLTQELAYEYWHRMLFARFLAENHLLMHPDGVAVSLAECEELANSENAPNGFVLAARYASRMLPQVFRTDDVLLEIEFAPEQRLALEKLLASLPRDTFLADDSLGWVYQFWQTKRKDEVNKSGDKIDGRTLPAVTQLFTEDYIVQFLLHNTIGAWWCARNGIGPRMNHGLNTEGEQEFLNGIDPCSVRVSSVAIPAFEYLRWRDDSTPAAGAFDGWPQTLGEFTMLDPCCGSGHFLVNAFNLLVPLRMHDEGLSAAEACDAVLHDNLFGLELDPRCTQIAAFALALAAWRYPGEDGLTLGHRELPPLNIAACGLAPNASLDEWLRVAERAAAAGGLPVQRDLIGAEQNLLSSRVRGGLEELYRLFEQGPTLGSLLDPATVGGDLLAANFEQLQPLLAAALESETPDAEARELGVAAHGFAKAARLLAGKYTLVATNVPYLGRGKQNDELKRYCEQRYPDAKADLATCFVERCLAFCARDKVGRISNPSHGTVALVTPQNWLFLGTYKKLRKRLLEDVSWNVVARLGPRAFETISGEVVNVALLTLTSQPPTGEYALAGLDASEEKTAADKAVALRQKPAVTLGQREQLDNPDARITLELAVGLTSLSTIVDSFVGILNGDSPRFLCVFWEIPTVSDGWEPLQSTVEKIVAFGGREHLVFWENGNGQLRKLAEELKDRLHDSDRRGNAAWGKAGVAVSQMRSLPCTLYQGELFDSNACVLSVKDESSLPAVWTFCSSPHFFEAVRRIDQKMNVTNATFAKASFDLAHWQAVAATARRRAAAGIAHQGVSTATDGTRIEHGSRRPRHVRNPCFIRVSSVAASSASRLQARRDAGRLAAEPVLRAALQAVSQPAVHLAHLGRSQRRLLVLGQLSHAGPCQAGEPDVLVPGRLAPRPGRRRASGQAGRRSAVGCGPDVAGKAQADSGWRAAV